MGVGIGIQVTTLSKNHAQVTFRLEISIPASTPEHAWKISRVGRK